MYVYISFVFSRGKPSRLWRSFIQVLASSLVRPASGSGIRPLPASSFPHLTLPREMNEGDVYKLRLSLLEPCGYGHIRSLFSV